MLIEQVLNEEMKHEHERHNGHKYLANRVHKHHHEHDKGQDREHELAYEREREREREREMVRSQAYSRAQAYQPIYQPGIYNQPFNNQGGYSQIGSGGYSGHVGGFVVGGGGGSGGGGGGGGMTMMKTAGVVGLGVIGGELIADALDGGNW